MEEVTTHTPASSADSSGQTSTVSTVTPEPVKKSKAGCIVAGVLGCFWLLIVAGLVIAVVFYFVIENKKDTTDRLYDDTYNGNTSNYNYNTNVDYTNEDVNTNIATNTSDLYTNVDTGENGELIAEDGTSLGFEADPIDPDLYAYQIGAYSSQHFTDTDWPGLQVTLDYPKAPPMTNADDVGSLWVGAVLDNNYFIQVGMMSSTESDADGNMEWTYFWQMWDDQDNYKYGLQEAMSNYDWDQNAANTFTMTCQDPDKGEWEFWVNEEVVGKVSTGSCDMDIYNGQVFWELTTPTAATNKDALPEFGPFTLGEFEYWDGYDWQPIQSSDLSYSYGRIIDGTATDQASVCPPYGVKAMPGKEAFQVGSTLACLENGAVLWE